MTLTLGMITLDTTDPAPIAAWWAQQTGGSVDDSYGESFLLVRGGSLPLTLGFQQVADPTPGKNAMHLDLAAPDLDAEVERLVAAGASIVGDRGDASFRWVTLADPQGHQFCVASS